jgi:tetratricopeptide (TPR) repeat protein
MRQGHWNLFGRRPGRDTIVELTVVGLVLGSSLILGGLQVPVSLGLCAVAALSCTLALQRSSLGLRALPLPALVAFALAGFTTLQTVPLPPPVIQWLSPRAADIWAQAFSLNQGELRWAPLSYDPGSSTIEGARWFTYGCTFVAAATIGRRRGSRWGATLLFLSAVLLALITFAHGFLQAQRVYGIYTPMFAPSRWHIGPLLNPNTLAGYLNLGAFSGLGLALSRRPRLPISLIGCGVALLFGVSLLSGSRGGVFLLPVGFGALILLHRELRKREGSRRSFSAFHWAILTAPLLGGIALAVLGSTSRTWQELAQRNIDKFQMLGWARPLIRDHLWVGIGRGAFESVFQQYRTGPDNLIYSHPENLIAQWISEWGIVVGGLGLVVMAVGLRFRSLGVYQQSAAIGTVVGALLVVLHNLVDLSLEVPAIPIALAAGLGACWGGAARGDFRTQHKQWGLASRVVALAGLLLVAHGVVRGLHPVAHDRLEIRLQLQQVNLKDPGSVRELRGALTAAQLRHPSEPYFPRIRAALALQLGDEPVLKWINPALNLSPWSGRTHLLLASALARSGPLHQALLELRFAAEYDPGLAFDVGHMAVSLTKTPALLERAAPPGTPGAQVLFAAAERLNGPDHAESRTLLLQSAVRHDPLFWQARRGLLDEMLSSCPDDARCGPDFEKQVAGLESATPDSTMGLEYRARRLEKLGRVEEAVSLLGKECLRRRQREHCLGQLLSYASQLHDAKRTAEAAKALVADACQADRCVQALLQAGAAMERAGELLTALAYFERAVEEQPNAQTLGALGRAAQALGLYSKADAALSRAAVLKGADPRARLELEKSRHRAWLRSLTEQKGVQTIEPRSKPRN